jgi:hypothetical protein
MDVCAPCTDSPLSYTGNIVGILTFVLGLSASILAIYALTRGALDEIDRFSQELESTRIQILPILRYCESEKGQGNADFADYQASLEQTLKILVATLTDLSTGLAGLKRFNPQSRNPFSLQVRRRAAWVYKRQHFVDGMAKISSQKGEVIVEQISLLLK